MIVTIVLTKFAHLLLAIGISMLAARFGAL
jgi:hypothetical protein